MHLQIWLPAKWNQCFEGAGGAGFVCTLGDALPPSVGLIIGTLASAIKNGYSSSPTDCGLTPAQVLPEAMR